MRFFIIILILIAIVVLTGCATDSAEQAGLSVEGATPMSEADGPTPIMDKPDAVQTLLKLAAIARQGGDMPGAIRLYEQALEKPGAGLEPLLQLASLYSNELQQSSKATGLLTAAAAQHMDDPAALGKIARALVDSGATSQALALYDQAVSLSPESPDLLNGKGVALDMLERPDDAQAVYHQGLALAKNHIGLNNNLALSYMLQGQYDRAISLLLPLVAEVDDPRVRQNLALAYGLSGNMPRAYEVGMQDLTTDAISQNVSFYRDYIEGRGVPAAADAMEPGSGYGHRPHPVIDRLVE